MRPGLVELGHPARPDRVDGERMGVLREDVREGDDGALLLSASAYLSPLTTYAIDPESGERSVHEEPEIEVDASRYEVTKLWWKYCDPLQQQYRQHPADYMEAMTAAVRGALAATGETPPPIIIFR